MSVSKGRFRFNDQFDLHLAREVYGQNPFEDTKRWSLIQVNMIQITGQCISIRTLREIILNLVKKYSIKAKALEGKSGIEISVTELDDLLQQIAKILSEKYRMTTSCNTVLPSAAHSKSLDRSSYQKGYNIREMACNTFEVNHLKDDALLADEPEQAQDVLESTNVSIENFNDQEIIIDNNIEAPVSSFQTAMPTMKRSKAQVNIAVPKRKRSCTNLKQSTVKYLEKKNENQYEMRNRELKLQEIKQELEERKFEMDTQERQKRLEIEERRLHMEEKRLQIELNLFTNQQELIKLLLKNQ